MNRNRLVATFLERRGYTESVLDAMNDDKHPLLLDIDAMADALHGVYMRGEHMVILPDFDMDGICSGTEAFAGFTELGFRVSLFRPDPSEGYGFGAESVERLVSEFPDAGVIITCDTGITCYEGVFEAFKRGIRVLVTDHHMEDAADGLHLQADVVVDPNRVDDSYPNKGICGAHVMWQVMDRYAERYRSLFEQEQIARLRVFAGIGTISDAMPLVNENRALVRDACGICRLAMEDFFVDNLQGHRAYVRAFRGLHVVLDMFRELGKIERADDIDEEFFAYYLAPMFNAAKRMNGDMDDVFGIFFGNDPKGAAGRLYQLNERRKAEVAAYLDELSGSEQPYAPYVYVSTAPSGILGLLAMKLIERSGVPTMVVAKSGNSYHGSGRAPEWYPALDLLKGEGFYAAGHQGAFGIGVTDVRELKSLHAFLERSVSEMVLSGDVKSGERVFDIYLSTFDKSADADVDIPLFAEYLREIERYAPFGVGFEKPSMSLTFRPEDADWCVIGSVKQHLKILLPHGFEVLCWNQANMLDDLRNAAVVRVVGSLGVSEFREKRTVNFMGDAEVAR